MSSACILSMAVMMLGLTSSSGLAALIMSHNVKSDCQPNESTKAQIKKIQSHVDFYDLRSIHK